MPDIVTVESDTEVLELDLEKCNGYGNCVFAAPDVFELDLATNVPTVLKDRFVDGDRADLVTAVADCPAAALRLRRRDEPT